MVIEYSVLYATCNTSFTYHHSYLRKYVDLGSIFDLWVVETTGGRRASPSAAAAAREMLRLTDFFVAGLLVCNAAAVLNEDRFLAKIGWGYEATRNDPPGIKRQVIMLLHASRVLLTIPLMALNVVVILLKLIIG